MDKERYIGIMSGTSLDGVDVVLCQIEEQTCHTLASIIYPFPSGLKKEILAAISTKVTLKEIGELHHRLGILFADAVEHLLSIYSIDRDTIAAIGSHGQTLWHEPEGTYPFSMQLGDPSIIATHTRIPVVADFRAKDIALGGQGAPLAPAFHRFLFGREAGDIAVVNIGGMANITILGDTLLGYDTGCGNVLLDLWYGKHGKGAYDKEGEWAKKGKVHYPLLEKMLNDPYFSLPSPKSTGRERFNEAWLRNCIKDVELPPEDIQRTLIELTAITISNEVLRYNRDILMLCGGGAKNSFLVERLAILMPNIHILIAEDADMLEAMMMAWLAYKRLHHEPVTLKDVTGANDNGILGGIYR